MTRPSTRAPAGGPVEVVVRARASGDQVLLEGVHAVKHAVRFGVVPAFVLSNDVDALRRLLDELAPDVADTVMASTTAVDDAAWRRVAPRGLPSPAIAVVARPSVDVDDILGARGTVLLLEQPRHLGNLGAAIRVAAAAGAGGVLVVGGADPYSPTAVRSAAGLQFALPVAAVDELPHIGRRLVALDAGGVDLEKGVLGEDCVLAVGTERGGLSDTLRARAHVRVGIPMREGVSSLNLATAVAVALYAG